MTNNNNNDSWEGFHLTSRFERQVVLVRKVYKAGISSKKCEKRMSEIKYEDKGVTEFLLHQDGNIENLRLLCFGKESVGMNSSGMSEESSYLELIKARHQFFSYSSTALNSTSEELTTIIKEFEENYNISNIVESMPGNNIIENTAITQDITYDDDGLEEIELPPGDVSMSSIDNPDGNLLKVDNFVADESMLTPSKSINGGLLGVESGDETPYYVPSFGFASNCTNDNCTSNEKEVSECTLGKMSVLLNGDSDTESVTDICDSSPILVNIPIQNMNLKMTTERKIRCDADLFLEHYMKNIRTEDHDQLLTEKAKKSEIVIDMADEDDLLEYEGSQHLESCQNDSTDSDDNTDGITEIPLRARRIITAHLHGDYIKDCNATVAELNQKSYDKIEIF